MLPSQKQVLRLIQAEKADRRCLRNFLKKRFIRGLRIIALLTVSLFWLLSPVAYGVDGTATTDTKAAVVIDGRPIFQVNPSGPYSAPQRAEQANRQLRLLANIDQSVDVAVVERNQLPTIVANDQYLLTVTELDATLDQTPSEQADEWANQLEIALDQAKAERDPDYVKYATWTTGSVFAAALFLHWLLGLFWGRLSRRNREGTHSVLKTGMLGTQDSQVFTSIKLWVARLGIWASTLWYVSSLFPGLRQRRYNLFNSSSIGVRAPLFTLGDQPYTLVDVVILLGLFWGLFALVQFSVRVLKTQILRRMQLERGAREVVTQTYRYVALAFGALIILQAWGIDLRSVTLLGSALGIGIGFGFQDIAKNFGSGLILLFERSIQVGDFIEVGEHSGVVERIGARSIMLRSLDNISVLVPNAHLIDSQVMNWNHDHPISRLHLLIGLDYGSESQAVKLALLQAAQGHPDVLAKPAPDVYLKAFGDDSIEFDLMVWIRNPELQIKVRSDLYFRMEEILKDKGLSIPFPQRDLHLRSGTLPIEFPSDITKALIKALERTEKG